MTDHTTEQTIRRREIVKKNYLKDIDASRAARREITKRWYTKNAEKAKANTRTWIHANPLRAWITSIKRGAKLRGLEFDLSVEDLEVPTHCPLLGLPLTFEIGRGKRTDNSASLDRLDSSKGYVKGNVWVVSWRANNLKRDATLTELKMLAANLEIKLNGATA